MSNDLYNHPYYYDLAFGWDQAEEISGLEKIWTRHFPGEVQSILEPACGSGRFLINLARRGYKVMGFDINPHMLQFSREQVKKAGLEDRVEIMEGDMVDFRAPQKSEVAVNLINSFSYLLDWQSIVKHLNSMASCLKPSGLYIIQISFRHNSEELPVSQTWTQAREGVVVTTTWEVQSEDPRENIARHRCRMEIKTGDQEGLLEEEHVMRSWTYPDFQELIRENEMWDLKAIYDADFQEVGKNITLEGTCGNLYLILARNSN